MKQFCYTCIFLFGSFFSKAQYMSFADSLFAVGEWHGAAIAYERAFFETSNNDERALALLRKSYCYKSEERFAEAASTLQRIRVTSRSPHFQEIVYEKVLINYLTGNYETSYNELLKLKLVQDSVDEDLIYLEALDLIGMNRWQEAKNVLMAQTVITGLSESALDALFPNKLKTKNPRKAYNLSMFLPGVGQMYAGYPFKGAMSGGMQAGLVGFSLYSMYQGYFFTGGLTGVALFYTFYFGGARYAKELAERKNAENAKNISQKLIAHQQKKPSR